MARKIIGIDFGSSQSSMAIMEIGSVGTPELLNVGGGRNGVTIPTVLVLDENDNTIKAWGNKVADHLKNGDANDIKFASNFKRHLGRNGKAKTKISDNEKNADLYCQLFIKELAEFLKHHRLNVKELDPNDYATCVAYPATWTDAQIKLLKKYVEEAGFPSDPDYGIYSIPEPVAAMHSLRTQDSNFRFGDRPEHYMVIDFGGGTLDICVIKTDILGKAPEIVSTSGDPMLGGKDFDEIIEHLFFRNNENITKSDLSKHELADLATKFKEAKEAFSENFRTTDVVTQPIHFIKGQYSLTVSKLEFSNICNDRGIYEKIRISIREALSNAQIDAAKIKKVILTGGSSKWFFVREIVAIEFSLGGESIFMTENPFTDVANGCAIAIGRPDTPPEKKGVWVKFRFSDKDEWSSPKCILKPARINNPSMGNGNGKLFIGNLPATKYFKPYTKFQHLSNNCLDCIVDFDRTDREICNNRKAS
jgi:Molecular chaperone